jgi:monoamine oxidase
MAMPAHVFILGAGAAGLAAARRLVEAGVPFTVLEARAAIGGRVRTLRSDGEPPIEAGPEFIHGDARELEQLLDETRTATAILPDRHFRRRDNEIRPLDFDRIWNVVFERLRTDHGPDRSFAEFLDECCDRLSADERQAAIDYVEGFNAADIRDIGTRWLRSTELEVGVGDQAPIRIVTSGFDRVIEALAARVPDDALRFHARVAKVRWRAGSVEVDVTYPGGRGATFAGDAAIVTLPISILKQSDERGVRFEPGLPDKAAALDRLRMGSVVKVKLTFAEPFWKSCGAAERGFLHLPGANFMTWWPLGDDSTITGWCGGPRAAEFAGIGEQAIVEHSLVDLAAALGTSRDEVFRRLRRGRAFDWGADPWSLGAYSYAAVGGADAARQLAEPVSNTLYFAGEATDPQFSATVGGAIRSGRRAADEILRSK